MRGRRALFATCSYPDYQPQPGLLPVRSSNGSPRYKLKYPPFTGTLLPVMASTFPNPAWVAAAHAGTMTKADFYARYSAMIRDRVDQILKEAAQVRKAAKAPASTRLVLLCFCRLEREGEWCHRTCLGQILAELTAEEVPELGRVRIPEIAADQPPTLF